MGNVLTRILGVSGAWARTSPGNRAEIEIEAETTKVRKPIRKRICSSLQSHVPQAGGNPACQNSGIVHRAQRQSFLAPSRLSNGKAEGDYKRLLLMRPRPAFRKALKLRNKQSFRPESVQIVKIYA
ncbi:MAG: hypothetical protein AB7V13_28435, partial [Pseudorhodoplanes sp.]